MSGNEVDLSTPEPTPDDVLRIDDSYFSTDTVAIVTGAASGIGRATALGLATNGLTVVGADIDTEGLDETASRIETFDVDGRFHGVETDLTDDADANPLFRVGDGSQSVDHYAVSTTDDPLNRALLSADYGDVLSFENVLCLWNDDEAAYNLVVDRETVVERVA